MIVVFLEDESEEIPPGPSNNFEDHVFQKSPLSGTIKLVAPIADFTVPYQWKTNSRLEREG
jgi:hypothetical protein